MIDSSMNSQQEELPFAPCQQQIWLDQQSYPDSAHLNIGGRSIVNGPLDLSLLEESLQNLTSQCEALRLCPTREGKQVIVTKWPDNLIEYSDISGMANLGDLVTQMIQENMEIPYLLDGVQRPWKVFVWRLKKEQHVLWIKFHHLVMDGYGTSVFFKQWSAINCAMAKGEHPPALDNFKYTEFIRDSLDYLKSDDYREDASFWRAALPTLPQLILQKRSSASDPGTLPRGHHYYDLLPRSEYRLLEVFSKKHKVSVYHLFVAALAIYLCRTKNRQDIVMGVPVLNRKGKHFKATLGAFSVVLPLKVSVCKGKSLLDLLGEIKRELRSVYRHTRYPLNHMTKELQMLETGRDAMFDVLLSFEPHSYNVLFDKAHLVQPRQLFATNARFPLLVNVCEFHEQAPVEFALESSSNYFTEEETKLLTIRLHSILLRMIESPEGCVTELPLIDHQEYQQLIVEKHKHVAHTKHVPSFIESFEKWVEHTPNAPAIRWMRDNQLKITTYKQFKHQIDKFAHAFFEMQLTKHIVPVITSRSPETIAAYFAIAKVGGAFLPVDPNTHVQRIKQILGKCSSPVVVVDTDSKILVADLDIQAIVIDEPLTHVCDKTLSQENVRAPITANDPAVVLFTSGSSGDPKGVVMTHGALAKRMAWLTKQLNFSADDIALQSIQLTFDPSLMEILLPLTNGGSLALPPDNNLAPKQIAHYAEKFGATYLSTVPTILRHITQTIENHPGAKLRAIGCGGERLTSQLAQEFFSKTGAEVYNFWGLTETTILSTFYRFDPNATVDPVPIGKPIDDTQIYILDKSLQPVPDGVTGEIFVGGSALSLGYLGEPELTSTKYIVSPFTDDSRLFKSGDLGYWDDAGQLQFVSRIDNMLKVRGQRVEPGQVESALDGLCFIKCAAVKLHEGHLHAWIELDELVDAEHLPTLINNINASLLKSLPAYMVPNDFTQMTALPRQSGGKLDYASLVADPITKKIRTGIRDKFREPENTAEKILLALWKSTLKQEQLHVDSDFFQNGGDSLMALNLLVEVETKLGYRLPLAKILHHPTVKKLASVLMEEKPLVSVSLSKHQAETKIYLAASGHGDVLRFQSLANLLEGTCNIEMLQPPITSKHKDPYTTEQLAELYASLIAKNDHQFPPILAGFSVAGIASLETGRKLIEMGVAIGHIVLIDSTYPGWLVKQAQVWGIMGSIVKTLRLQNLHYKNRKLGSVFSDESLNAQIGALRHYQPKPIEHPVVLISSSGFKRWYKYLLNPWHKLLREHLTEMETSGFHASLFEKEHIVNLAEIFESLSAQPKCINDK